MLAELIEDLVGLSDSGLDEHIRALELRRRADTTHMACAIAVADARRLNAVDGHRTMKGYLRATCNWSNHEVARMRSLARAVDAHPTIGDALLDGRLGGPQAFELAKVHGNRRVAERFAEFLPLLVQAAEELSYDDFRIALQRFTLMADPDGAHRDTDASIENRNARMVDVGGSIDVRMTGGDPLVTAELLAIFNEFVDAEFEADLAARRAEHGDDAEAHELSRTAKQRRHDAAVAIFRAARHARTAGNAADPLVNIVVDAATFARVMADAGLATDTDLNGESVDPFTGLADDDDLLNDLTDDLLNGLAHGLSVRRCETTNGVTLHPHHVLRAALSGHIRRVVVDSAGVVIDQGRKQRLFTGSARDAARLLVKHCEHPGCDLPPEWCQIDHADEWFDGGVTDQINARVRCAGHNLEKHRRKLRSRRSASGNTYTIRADGTIMLPVGARQPVLIDDDDTADTSSEPADVVRATRRARDRVAALRRSA